jgi:hypothetical protein
MSCKSLQFFTFFSQNLITSSANDIFSLHRHLLSYVRFGSVSLDNFPFPSCRPHSLNWACNLCACFHQIIISSWLIMYSEWHMAWKPHLLSAVMLELKWLNLHARNKCLNSGNKDFGNCATCSTTSVNQQQCQLLQNLVLLFLVLLNSS